MIGCVLCSPGCFSLFRGKALMDDNVMKRYTMKSDEARHYVQYDQGSIITILQYCTVYSVLETKTSHIVHIYCVCENQAKTDGCARCCYKEDTEWSIQPPATRTLIVPKASMSFITNGEDGYRQRWRTSWTCLWTTRKR